MASMKATYMLQQENKTNKGSLSLAVPHSDLSATFNIFNLRGYRPDFDAEYRISKIEFG